MGGGRKHRWSEEDDNLLMNTVGRQGALDEEIAKDTGKKVLRKEHWLRVSCALFYLGGPSVTPGACQMRWLSLTGKKKRGGSGGDSVVEFDYMAEIQSRLGALVCLSRDIAEDLENMFDRALVIDDKIRDLENFVSFHSGSPDTP